MSGPSESSSWCWSSARRVCWASRSRTGRDRMTDGEKGFHPLAWFDTRVSGLVSGGAAWSLYAVGLLLAIVSVFMAWDYDPDFGGDLTVYGYPGGVQVFMIVLAVLGLLFWLGGRGLRPFTMLTPGGAARGLQAVAWGALALIGYVVLAIAYKLGGL